MTFVLNLKCHSNIAHILNEVVEHVQQLKLQSARVVQDYGSITKGATTPTSLIDYWTNFPLNFNFFSIWCFCSYKIQLILCIVQ
jgi:hypothetical protein